MAIELTRLTQRGPMRGYCLLSIVVLVVLMGLEMVAVEWGPRGLGLLVLAVVFALLLRWLWRRWFPHRATRELNKVIGRVRLHGRARLVRSKCRRRGRQWELAWRVPTGVTTSGLMNAREVIEHALDCSAEFWFERGLMWMRAGTARLPKVIGFEDFEAHQRPAGELVLGIGYGRTGPVWVDLIRVPHLLVGGTPGAGKSVFLRQVLVGLCLRYGPDVLRLVLIDLKGGMEFHVFRGLPHLLVPTVSDLPALVPAMEVVLAELDRRQAMFAAAGVVSVQDWNRRHPAERVPYIVVAVDEYGEVSLPGAEPAGEQGRGRSGSARAMHASFSRVARLGRASGIHLIACTQRPDADVLPGQIKDQLPGTVAFRTRSQTNSHILLGDRDDAAARLAPYKGRAVWQWETESEVQAPWLSPEAAVRLLAERCRPTLGVAQPDAARRGGAVGTEVA
jgi:FtsK/SpoIIIE family